MDFKTITIPLRVFVAVSRLSIFEWVDMYHNTYLYSDTTIYKRVNSVCNELGVAHMSKKYRNNVFNGLSAPFKIKDAKKLCVAKLKYNF